MKILQINKFYYPVIGGIETIVKDIAEDLNNKDDISVDVLSCKIKGKGEDCLINGVKVFKSSSFGRVLGMPLSFNFFKKLFAIEQDYDVLLFHFPFPLSAIAIPFLKNKNVYILYHSDIVRQKISQVPFIPFIKYGLKKAKKIIVSSKNLIENSKTLRKYKNKCEVNYFGININNFSLTSEIKIKSECIRKQYPTPLLLSVGRLVYYKGYEYLVKSMSGIENAHLLIIGEGALEKKLKKIISEEGLNEKISIIKPVENLRPYYNACDIFIFPSVANSEAFGLVQIEAMSFGKPIINTNLPTGVPEVSLNNVSGITVEPKNIEELNSAINKIISSKEMQQKYGDAAKERVKNIFNRKKFNERLLEIIS